jgi:plasmid replication initiation protein
MKNGLVVKDNALINASYNLETTEQRLIMLAIMSARDTGQGITADSKLEIHASDYANQFNVTNETAYEVLKSAVNNLFERKFSYIAEYKKTGKTGIVRSRWVSRVFYVDTLAILEITFAPDVVPLITRLEENFTSYQLKQVSQLTSKYAIRLYELLIAWREVGKTPQIDLAEFRQKIGVEAKEYERMHHFKARVLEPSIKQINEHTDITVTYEQHKKGRTISGFSFKLKQKQKAKKVETNRDQDTQDLFTKMTDAQRHLFGHKLAHDERVSSDYSHLVGTGSYEDFAKLLADMLAEEQHFKMFYPLLVEHGFK